MKKDISETKTKKKTPKKEITKEKKKRAQIDRIKTNILPRILRVALWTILTFVFLRGAMSFATQKPEEEIIAKQRTLINQAVVANDKTFVISSFAEGFIKNYCTYSALKADDYKLRLSHFMTKALSEEMIEGIRLVDDADAIYTNAVALQKQNENQYDVVVMVDVLFTKYPKTTDTTVVDTNAFTQRKTLYYTVPVFYQNNMCIVEDFPFVALMPPKIENYEVQSSTHLEVSEGEREAIKTLLGDFSKSLFEESQNKINYYLADIKNAHKFTALNGIHKLVKVDLNTAYLLQPNKYLATATLTLQDANESMIKQKVHFIIVKQDRYLIEDMGLRVRNLNNLGG